MNSIPLSQESFTNRKQRKTKLTFFDCHIEHRSILKVRIHIKVITFKNLLNVKQSNSQIPFIRSEKSISNKKCSFIDNHL